MLGNLIDGIKEAIFSNQFFGGAFWLSLMMGLMYQLKGLPITIWSFLKKHLFYTVYFDENDELYYYFEKWLDAHHPHKYRIVEASLEFKKESFPNDHEKLRAENGLRQYKKIHKKQFEDTFVIMYHGAPLYVFKGRDKLENANNLRMAFLNHYKIIGIRSKKKIDKLLDEVVVFNTVVDESVSLFFNSEYGDWIFAGKKVLRDEASVVLRSDIKERLFSRIDTYLDSRDWYTKRGIIYKYGIMLEGPPGNGKSSIIQAIARKYLRDIYYLDMHGKDLSDFRLKRLFNEIKSGTIIVVEDIDTYFKGKRELSNKSLSFSCLLSCLDGINSQEDIIIIFTTNKPVDLDEALIRPGRIDTIINIPKPTLTEVNEYHEVFFGEPFSGTALTNGHSMSEIQDIFLSNVNSRHRIPQILCKETDYADIERR